MNSKYDIDHRLIVDLNLSKNILFQSLNINLDNTNNNGVISNDSLIANMKNEYMKIKKRVDDSFHLKLSNSLVVIGNSLDSANQLITSVLKSYDQYNSEHSSFITSLANRNQKFCKNYTIKVNGFAHLTDHEAIIDMANQFYTRNEKDSRDFGTALEDLEQFFIQCRVDGIPAVIIIEDIHVFAKRKRQTLIYTLLDLMHKSDCLFTLIGVTDHADIDQHFEKRIKSRLNAQYIYLPNPTTTNICEFLANKLLLPEVTQSTVELKDNNDISDTGAPYNYIIEISASYITKHNDTIRKLFGSYQKQQTNNDDNGFSVGSMFPFIAMYKEWGRGLDFFHTVSLKALMMMNHVDNAYWTENLFQKAAMSMDPPRMLDVLASLTPIELHLMISVAHLYGRQKFTKSSSMAVSKTMSTQNPNSCNFVCTVEQVLLVCDMLVDVIRKNITPKCRVIQALCSLAQKELIFLANVTPGKSRYHVDALSLGVIEHTSGGSNNNDRTGITSITGRTLVLLSVPYEQIKIAFKIESSNSNSILHKTTQPSILNIYQQVKEEDSGGVSISVSERLRRAVLEPLEPILYTSQKRDLDYIL